jgi:RNA polymerase sigma-70 factor, ECF subfamily
LVKRFFALRHDPRFSRRQRGFFGSIAGYNYLPKVFKLATQKELSQFLTEAERRAYKQALFAVRDNDAALDIVQDSMLKLSEKYGDKPAAEFPMLFQRILQNTIRDYYRRTKVRSLWTTLFSSFTAADDDETDPLEVLRAESGSSEMASPPDQLQQSQVFALIEEALKTLPPRQREAFLMRYWEDMDVAETAAAMGCSEGSVKTHCSRATHALAAALKAKGIEL